MKPWHSNVTSSGSAPRPPCLPFFLFLPSPCFGFHHEACHCLTLYHTLDLLLTAVFLMPRTGLHAWCSLEASWSKHVFQKTGLRYSPSTCCGVIHKNVCFVLTFLKLKKEKKSKYYAFENLLLKGKVHFINLA